MGSATITLTVGVSGSGKTYRRCAMYIADEWLPKHTGVLYCNYPVNFEGLEKDFEGYNVRERIRIIDDDELQKWRTGQSGPWDYFKGIDLSGSRICIDEAHNFCHRKSDLKIRRAWSAFVGELRHRGAQLELLTQNEQKLATELLNEAEIKLEIINGESRRLPIFGFRMGDLYELRAKIIGKYLAPSYEVEYIQYGSRFRRQHEEIFYRIDKYFHYYDSFSAPQDGESKGGKAEKHPYEVYSFPVLLLWFFSRYPIRMICQVTLISLFCWLCFFGGAEKMVRDSVRNLSNIGKNKARSLVIKKDDVKQETKTGFPERKLQSVGNKGKTENVNKWVRLHVSVATLNFVKLSDGSIYKIGDDFYLSRIALFVPRKKLVVLDDGFVLTFDEFVYLLAEW